MNKLIEIAGWLGVALIFGAYAANVFELLSREDFFYLALNAVGAALVGWNAYVKRAYPPLALEILWVAVSLFGIVQIF